MVMSEKASLQNERNFCAKGQSKFLILRYECRNLRAKHLIKLETILEDLWCNGF